MGATTGGLTILKEMMPRLSPSEQKIARYILNHPSEIIDYTAKTLGEKSQTSSAGVIRLCKSIGFKGFQELKIRVAGDLKEDEEDLRDIEPKEDYKHIVTKATSNINQTIRETTDILDINKVKQAVKALRKAKSILFIGFGASYVAAIDAEQKFVRINKNARALADVHMAATFIANKGPGDVIVAISFSGETKEVIQLLELAEQKGAKIISITQYGKTSVGRLAHHHLYTSASREAVFRSGATSSRIAQLYVIDILFMCLASEEYEETIGHLNETRAATNFLNE
ncbi:RpiR family transcriptional regulator [Salimicrobium jeotgali]|uniref:RpiR family transcriptional regulator n=1 Tax=Salimicrobium jeotgali TaxID=1230341 RepID=K2FJN8_9BACI|nr:MurR/RpiR family transcriptional regulator [Salimicrobium jeotgali]AKG03790.1 RpiR family transcriptional regulator [Salimicrobium jeotgali]EKE31276.1 RpiR family transcriptional regulator [Salimicrobium jeotgali]MBM7697088.1 DNA-binding MurR/RpiR family transcriptional regulator [Salimicrobium jeotgali]